MKLPVLFIGHGSPMNALESNRFTQRWTTLARSIERPRAILSVSAHWLTRGSFVTAGGNPKTIHDFGGFPRALHDMQYAAPGNEPLSDRVAALTGAVKTPDWGLDHGTWSVLLHMYPAAEIPVVQLSINASTNNYLELGALLRPLSAEGVLIVANGNIVHNLEYFSMERGSAESAPLPWAQRFDDRVRDALVANDRTVLANYEGDGDARLSVPTPEHYVPLLYAAGAAGATPSVAFPVEGFDGPSISMRAVAFS